MRLKILEGDGQVFGAGSRAQHPVSVQVTDETGKPVEGATVSFRLPDEGATGSFAGGMKTDIAITGADGKASASTVQWDSSPGSVSVRVTTAKDQVRAGMTVSLYLSDAPVTPTRTVTSSRSRSKWLMIGLVAAGATAGGLALGLAKSPAATSAGPAASTLPQVQIGSPTISVGKP